MEDVFGLTFLAIVIYAVGDRRDRRLAFAGLGVMTLAGLVWFLWLR